jgi:hypothetical protein
MKALAGSLVSLRRVVVLGAAAVVSSCGPRVAVTKVAERDYRLECRAPLAECLVKLDELCGRYGYDVIDATERRDYSGPSPEGYESVKASATARCRVAKPLIGKDPNEPLPPRVAPSAAPPPVAPAP